MYALSRPAAPHPMAFLAACLACGVAVARFYTFSIKVWLGCGLVLSAFAAFVFVRRRFGLASLLLGAAFMSAGATMAVVESGGVARNRVERLYEEGTVQSGEPVELTGVLERAPETAPDGFYMTLRVEQLRYKEALLEASGVVWLFAPVRDSVVAAEYEDLHLRYGARVRVMVALRRAESFRNPGVASLTEYLERRGYDATGTIKSPLLLERLDDERVFLPLLLLYEWRQRLLASVDKSFKAETAGVLKAALFGNRFHLSRGAAERFRQGGTFHILVISGLHISFIGSLVFIVMRRLTKHRAWQFIVSVLFLWAYALAVGAESSVVRAALMFTFVALAPVLHRRASSLNALGAAALLLLAWRPSDLLDPSFQLTFLSVLAIVCIAWPLIQRLKEVGEWRPTRETPRPPLCSRLWRALGEALFWSDRQWREEMDHSIYSYCLWKTPAALWLERRRLQRPLRYAFGALVVTASVQVSLLPLLVLYFHRLSIAAFILNIVVGALMALLALLALLSLPAAELSATVAAPLVRLAESVSWLMLHSVDPFTSARAASVRLPEYQGRAASVYILYYVPLVILATALARWRPVRRSWAALEDEGRAYAYVARGAGLTLALLTLIIILHPFSAPRPDGRLRVDFLDVGQGDAALVTMPDGTTILVDGGGRTDYRNRARGDEYDDEEAFERDTRGIGESVVSEYLWWRGLDSVDYLVATHADADHMDGLNDIMQNFRVRAALVGRAPLKDAEYARFTATASSNGVPVYVIGRGDVLELGAVRLEVLWPRHAAYTNARSRNDDSVVLRIRYGDRNFLLTGDIERKTEEAIVRLEESLGSDVVKVAHHGSRTSSIESFVAATRPQLAIISVGLDSIFGHPHREIVERWEASSARILQTGRWGMVTISTNGSDLKVETFVID